MDFELFRYSPLPLRQKTNKRYFNTSLVELLPDLYLFAVRSITFRGKGPIIPGNSERCAATIDKSYLSTGENFWWNNWGQNGVTHLFDDTEFYLAPLEGPLMDPVEYDILYHRRLDRESITSWKQGGDIRLFKSSVGICYAYSSHPIYLYRVVKKEVLTFQQLGINLLFFFKEPYKNVSLVEVKEDGEALTTTWVDWYYPYGVRVFTVTVDQNEARDHVPFRRPKYRSFVDHSIYYYSQEYPILGEGSYLKMNEERLVPPRIRRSDDKCFLLMQQENNEAGFNYGKMPAFSFSTPLVSLDNGVDAYLGVGHLKIHSDEGRYPYLPSNISLFRERLYDYMEALFGSRYRYHFGVNQGKECSGYIYLLYFYLISGDSLKRGNKLVSGQGPFRCTYDRSRDATMRISDGYLPVEIGGPEYYKFSLVFPMGLSVRDDIVTVSAGVGDYYSVIMEFDLESVIASCIHNPAELDMDNYNYYVVEISGNEHETVQLY